METLVSVMLMGIVVTAILGALFTLVRTADLNREKTRASSALQTFAEQVRQPVQEFAYVPCNANPRAAYQAQVDALTELQNRAFEGQPDYEVEVVSVAFVQGSFNAEGRFQFSKGSYNSNDSFGTGCTTIASPTDHTRDGGLQQITITVRSGLTRTHPVSDTIVIVKRDARCPRDSFDDLNPDAGPC